MLVIDVSDDGAGIDTQRVLAKARALGLTDSTEPSEAETRRLIFTPGFSTAETITEISGRGVGMDVVHQMIVSMRGSISVTSEPGSGTTFSIRVPLSLAIIDALAVEAAGETYVLPLEFVTECIDVDEAALHDAQTGTIALRERTIPFVRLAAFMGVTKHHEGRKSAVILSNRKRVTALVLDRLIGRVEAVVKPLRGFSKLQGIAGATVLGDGSIALILDVPRLLQKQIREVA
jgi:two-component system, chemotaxis family, sensor kinase CheA